MSTKYISTYIPLTEGQKKKLARAIKNSSEVSLLIDKHQIKKKGNTELYLTERQITRHNKVKSEGKGITLSLSKTQISKMPKDMIGKGIQVTPPNNNQGGKGMQIEYPFIHHQSLGKKDKKKAVEKSNYQIREMHYLTDHRRLLVLGINIIIFSKLED